MKKIEDLREEIKEISKKYKSENDIDILRQLKKRCFELTAILVTHKKIFKDEEIRNDIKISKKLYQKISKRIFNLTPHYFRQQKSNLDLLATNYDTSISKEVRINLFKQNVANKVKSCSANTKVKNYKIFLKELKKDKKYYSSIGDIEALEIIDAEISLLKEKINKEKDLTTNIQEKAVCPIVLNNRQKNILKRIENIDLEEFDLKDIIKTFTYYISQNDIYENYDRISEIVEYIKIELVEYMVDNSELPAELNYLINILKNKYKQYNKYSKERILIKEILNSLKEINNIYKVPKTDEKTNPYFSIICYLIQDSKNYLYIKEILKRNDSVCNIKYNNQHIVIYILDLYIENFKKMVADKDGNYININYIQEVYFLFTKNSCLRISKAEKQIIDKKLLELKEYIKLNLDKKKTKEAALEDVKSMNTRNFYSSHTKYKFEEVSDNLLTYESNNIFQNYRNSYEEKEYTPVFLINDFAYSMRKTSNKVFITMYSIDLSKYISKKSILSNYLYACVLNNENVDDLLTSKLSIKQDVIYPAFAYELEFSSTGLVKNLKIYKDYIKATSRIINTKIEGKEIHDFYKKSAIKNSQPYSEEDLYIINDYFESILNKEFAKFVDNQQLPFIYYGYSGVEKEEKEVYLSELSSYFSKLDKSDSSELINIFSNIVDKNHYSIYPMKNPIYKLSLINAFTYLGICTQRMLNDLYFNERRIEDLGKKLKLKKEYFNTFIKEVDKLNKTINYVDQEEIKRSKGRIRYYHHQNKN